VRKLILEQADVAVVSWRFRLAVLKDANLDVSKMPLSKSTKTRRPGLMLGLNG
jgi:hypothetical protein